VSRQSFPRPIHLSFVGDSPEIRAERNSRGSEMRRRNRQGSLSIREFAAIDETPAEKAARNRRSVAAGIKARREARVSKRGRPVEQVTDSKARAGCPVTPSVVRAELELRRIGERDARMWRDLDARVRAELAEEAR
jgi:hypothetical protein